MTRLLPTYVRNDKFTGTSPYTSGGSREHFFHFLLGYLLPLVHAQTHYCFSKFLVLDCGPLMTPILNATLMRLNFKFEIVPSSSIETPFYLEAWDSGWDSNEAVRDAINRVRVAWENHMCTQKDCALSHNLLLERSKSHVYYEKLAEVNGYGTNRRHIMNWQDVCTYLNERDIDHVLYEPGRHCFGCQIATFTSARRIVGMRGAEWANIVWSPPGLRARVLDPDPPAKILIGLLDRLNVHYEFAVVRRPHTNESPKKTAKFLSAI